MINAKKTNAARKGDLEWPGWETFLFDIKRLGKELALRLTFEQKHKESAGVGRAMWGDCSRQREQHGSMLQGQEAGKLEQNSKWRTVGDKVGEEAGALWFSLSWKALGEFEQESDMI